MGCGGSKADEASLVALCRERKDHVRAAADYRYAMAASHVAYFDSLRAVGEAILRFVEEDLVVGPPPESSSSSSPVLTLPRDGKKTKKPKPKPSQDGVSSSTTTSISHSAEDHHHHEHDDDNLEDSHLHLTSSPSSSGSGRGAAHFGGGEESGYGNVGAGGSRRYHHPVEERGYGDFGSGGVRYFYPPPEEEQRGPIPQGGGWGGGARFGEGEEYGNVGPSYHYPEEGGGGGALPSQGSWGGGYGYPEAGSYSYPPETENQYASSYPFPSTTYGNPSFGAYYMRKAPTPARTVVYDDPNTRGFSRSDYLGGDASGGGGGNYYGNGFFGYPPMGGYPSQPPRREPSPERKPPPPPPSPPRPSTWDFLNVFEAAGGGPDGYFYPARGHGYGSTTSSPDSKEVREREGIPELEDETESEVLKEVYGDKNSKRKKKKVGEEAHYGNVRVGSRFSEETGRNFGEGTSKARRDPVVDGSSGSGSLGSGKGEGIKSSASPDTFRSPESIVTLSPEEDEEIAQFVKKKGVSFEVEEVAPTDLESSKVSSLTTLSNQGTRDLQEVAREIRSEFESATGYGKEVAVMLEVGKLPYQRRTALLKVIVSRILFLVSSHPPTRPSIHISSRTMKMAKSYSGEPGTDFDMDAKNLSSTLQQLYVWEKKLYREVKDEERLRLMYDKMCKRLQNLDARGAESTKIDATRVSIRKLLTKINVNIRAINAISRKIHRLRDEELMPQITELIHSLIRMWKSMLRCHHKQFQAIMESKIRHLRANTGLQGDSGLKATIDLENELINWCTRFNKWISSQKLYVQSLNEWLSRCLNRETEETADGPAPFSPSRVGAPPIFVICNDWHHAMTAISEKVVENTMIDFASKLHQLWEQQDEEKRQRSKAEYVRKDFEKRLRDLRLQRGITEDDHDASSDKTMSKVASDSGVSRLDDLKVDLDMMSKKLEDERIRHKEAAKLVHLAASGSVQGGLVPIFEALGKFSSEVLKAHEHVRLQYVPDDGGP